MVGRTHARIKGGPSQYSTLKRLLRSPFSGSQDRLVVEPRPLIEDVFENSTRFLKNVYDYGAQAAGLLLALCHSRACQQQALRDPRSNLVGEW